MPPLQRRNPSRAEEELEKSSGTLLGPALRLTHQHEWVSSGEVELELTEVLEEGQDLRVAHVLPFAVNVLGPREQVSAGLRIRTALGSL